MQEGLTYIYHIGSMTVRTALVLAVGVKNAGLLSSINNPHAAYKSHTVQEELKHFHIGSMAILSALVLEVGVNNACILPTISTYMSHRAGRAYTYISYWLNGDSVYPYPRNMCK